jgi:hypothetical protein
MRKPISIYLTMAVGMSIVATFSGPVSAQVPEPGSVPRLAVPAREAPVAQTPGQPTTAPTAAAPAESTAVSAAPAPSGVTQLPPAAAPPATVSTSQAAMTKDNRAYSTANVVLDLDGVNVGPVRAVEGGAVVGTVVAQGSKKHLAGVKYEELSLKVGIESKAVVEWIRSSWEGKSATKNLSVAFADHNYKVVARRDFTNALLTGTTIPALDGASSKEPVSLTLTIAPDQIREIAGDGGTVKMSDSKKKMWLLSNFRFEMGDLPGQRVSRIESFTVGQKLTEDPHGEFRLALKQPGTLVFPNLKLTFSQPDADWAKWHNDFVVNGKNGDEDEKNGAIVFLDPSLKNELGRISLFHCGIFRFGTVPGEANVDKVGRVGADLYCEGMELVVKDAWK